MTEIHTISDLTALREKIQDYRNNFKSSIVMCGGTGCQASRSRVLIDAVKKELGVSRAEVVRRRRGLVP